MRSSRDGHDNGLPEPDLPPALGKVGNSFIAPFRVKNWKSEPIIVRLYSVQSDGTDLLDRKVVHHRRRECRSPLDVLSAFPFLPHGRPRRKRSAVFDNDLRISPTTSGTLTFTYTGRGGLPLPGLTFLYVVYIIVALALLYGLVRLFLFIRKKMQEVPVTGFAGHGGSRWLRPKAERPARRAAASAKAGPAPARGLASRTQAIPLIPVPPGAAGAHGRRPRPCREKVCSAHGDEPPGGLCQDPSCRKARCPLLSRCG